MKTIWYDKAAKYDSAVALDLLAIQQRFQDDIDKIAAWKSDNKMVLNVSTTKRLLVSGKRLKKKAPDTNLKLSCNGGEIEQIASRQKLLE